jgi:hypothetical protein
MDSTIIAAIITAIGTIAAALIGLLVVYRKNIDSGSDSTHHRDRGEATSTDATNERATREEPHEAPRSEIDGGDTGERAVPPLPQYDKSEVQWAIEKQQEAVKEYAYPYTLPRQLKTSGEDVVAGTEEDVGEHPIRAMYRYLGGYSEGVIVGAFNPVRDSRINPEKGHVALSYPRVWVDVTSLAEVETVTLSPYLLVGATEVRRIPDRVNYVVFPTGGAGGEIRWFGATLSPERKGTFYAPQWTPETALEPYSRPNKEIYPFFPFRPGEKSYSSYP